jgi:hypothetical protein
MATRTRKFLKQWSAKYMSNDPFRTLFYCTDIDPPKHYMPSWGDEYHEILWTNLITGSSWRFIHGMGWRSEEHITDNELKRIDFELEVRGLVDDVGATCPGTKRGKASTV